MRFINVDDLEENMILARPVYSGNGIKLLQEGAKLKKNYKPKIKQLGYSGVYVQDELLKDVEVNDLISEEIKRESVNNIKKTFQNINNKATISSSHLDDMKGIINKLLEDITNNQNVMVDMVDLKMYDEYLFQHSVNVAVLSVIVALSMGYNQNELYKIGLGALLHDIGKVSISSDILNKQGDISDEEFEQIKSHASKGYEKLKDNDNIPSTSKVIPIQHHERVNGEGYPEGKSKEDIHIYSRIVAVSDVFDALISDRPYRKGYVPAEAMEYILGGAGYLFDMQVVGHFFKKVAAFPVGTEVVLSDSRIALVIENFEKYSLRPKVRIIQENGKKVDPYDIDLREEDHNKLTVIKTN